MGKIESVERDCVVFSHGGDSLIIKREGGILPFSVERAYQVEVPPGATLTKKPSANTNTISLRVPGPWNVNWFLVVEPEEDPENLQLFITESSDSGASNTVSAYSNNEKWNFLFSEEEWMAKFNKAIQEGGVPFPFTVDHVKFPPHTRLKVTSGEWGLFSQEDPPAPDPGWEPVQESMSFCSSSGRSCKVTLWRYGNSW